MRVGFVTERTVLVKLLGVSPRSHPVVLCVSAMERHRFASAWMQSAAKLISIFVSDTAKEVHKNTTKEAMNILRYLTDREKRMEQSYEDSKSIVTSLQGVREQMLASSATLDVTSAAMSSTLRRLLDEFSERFSAVIFEAEERAVQDHIKTISRVSAVLISFLHMHLFHVLSLNRWT